MVDVENALLNDASANHRLRYNLTWLTLRFANRASCNATTS